MVKTTGVEDIVYNPQSGDPVGDAFTITNQENAASEVEVWIDKGSGNWSDRDLVKGIQVSWADGSKDSAKGNTSTATSYVFKFKDDETVQSMTLRTGDRVDKISFTTNKNRTFAHGGDGGVDKPQKLGNGVLLGFKGTYDSNELTSLGSVFDED